MEKHDFPPKKKKHERLFNAITLKDAPYEGLLLAIALSLPPKSLLPWASKLGIVDKQWFFCGILCLVCGLLFFVNIHIVKNATNKIEKPCSPWKWVNSILEGLTILLFSPFGMLMLVWVGFKKRRPWAVIMSCVGLLLFLYALFINMGLLPFRPLALFLCMIACPLVMMVAIVSAGGLKFRQNIVRISFAIAAVSAIIRMTTEYPIAKLLTEASAEMEARLADYRQQHGIVLQPCDESFINQEPLKSVVSHTQDLKALSAWDWKPLCRLADVQKLYDEISSVSDELHEAVIALAAIPPRPVAHLIRPMEARSSFNLSVSEILLEDSYFLSIEMTAKARQPNLIHQNNTALLSLRDWCLQQNHRSDDKLQGRMVESTRLKALLRTLPQNRYTEAEWVALLGDEPDWRYFAACAYKADADYQTLQNTSDEILDPIDVWLGNSLYSGVQFLNCGLTTTMKRIFMDSEAYIQKSHAQFVSLSLDDHSTMEDARMLYKKQETYKEKFFTFLFLKPSLFYYDMQYSIQDERQMAMLAWKIMEYKHEHNGVLPENLAQIGKTPVSAINGLPIVYDHGDIEVYSKNDDDFTTICGFRLFVPHEDHASPPNWQEVHSRMEISLE